MNDLTLYVPESTEFKQWEEMGHALKGEGGDLERSLISWKFRVGDWLRHGERRYGETYSQGMDIFGDTPKTYRFLADVKYVASRIPLENRNTDTPWSHYKFAAKFPPAEQVTILKQLRENKISMEDLQEKKNDASEYLTASDKGRIQGIIFRILKELSLDTQHAQAVFSAAETAIKKAIKKILKKKT